MVTNKLALLLALACATTHAREAASPAACQSAGAQPAISDATAALGADPTSLQARLKLADAWSDAGCFGDAISVLRAGDAAHPHDKELQTRLQVAKSLVTEQSYFDTLDRASKEAQLSRAMLRCAKLADLASCDDAIAIKPKDPALLIEKADTLTQLKRPAAAIVVYRAALAATDDAGAGAGAVNSKIQAAELQRRTLLEVCETRTGEPARQACEAALLAGASDEAAVYTRRGLLLQGDNQLSPALDSFMAAQRVKSGDDAVALAIISLSDSTGRKDALTLAARGSAFMTLGHPELALEPLRQALRLAPDLTEPKIQLRAAEQAKAPDQTPMLAVKPPPNRVLAAIANSPAARLYSNDAPVSQSN